ncbi:MAG: DUF4430 domain-containing protein [Eubacteriales bacterium]|nr:DUF4430 domain-containing protein [Eubacteriales bacterium]
MFDRNRKYKYIGIAVIAVILVIFAVTNIKIKTVNQHKAEQQSIADAQREYSTISVSQGNGENEQAENPQTGNISNNQSSSEEVTGGMGASSNDNSSNNDSSNSSSSDGNSFNNDSSNSSSSDGNSSNNSSSNNNSSKDNLSGNNSTTSIDNGNNNSTNVPKKNISCTIEIRCDNATAVKSTISNPGLQALIPDDGVMLKTTTYTGTEGMTVYDVLSEVGKLNNLDIVSNPGHTYVMGIGGLKEKMIGITSGWMYSVNGKAPNYGANAYEVKNGDVILWYYVVSD